MCRCHWCGVGKASDLNWPFMFRSYFELF
jgi:hypothetical protein